MKIKINISVNKAIQVLLLFLFVANVADGLFAPLFAVFVVKSIVGATIKTVGFSIALAAVAKSLIQLPLAKRIDKKLGERDDFYVMLAGSVAGVVYPIGLIFARLPWQLYLLSVLNGAGIAFFVAAYYSMFSHHIDRGSEGFEWSLFSVWGNTLSVAVGGVVGGIVADAIGFTGTFIFAAIVNLIATILLVFLYPLLDDFKKKKQLPTNMPMP